MPYCITLRSRTDARITGWYGGRNCLWSTDHNRQKRFDNSRDASTVCRELRSLCPRNVKVINIEVTGGRELCGKLGDEVDQAAW
jgi:hypothetical protein